MSYLLTVFIVALTALSWLLFVTVAPDSEWVVPLRYLATFLTAISAARLAEFLVSLLIGEERSQQLKTTDLVRVMSKVVIYIAALLIWLYYGLGFNVTNLLATSAVLTIVIGLALQSTLGNLFSGLALELDRPVRVGDYLRRSPVEGTIEGLTWRSIFLRASNGSIIVVPNSGLSANQVEVFPAGTPTYHTTAFIFRQMVQMHGELGEYAKEMRTMVRLLANTAAMVEYLPGRLAPWLVSHPQIDVDLRERQSSDIVKAVSGGLAEIGIISDAVEPASLQLRPFAIDRLVVVAARDHAFAGKKELSFVNLLQHEFVGLADGALHDHIEAQAARRGKRLKVRIKVRTLEGACWMVAQGGCLGIMPEPAARRYRRSMPIAWTRLSDDWATRRLSICFRSEEDLLPVARDLVAHLSSAKIRNK